MPKEATTQAKEKHQQTHEISTDLNREDVAEITTALRRLLADTFALYLKTKNFHWHMPNRPLRPKSRKGLAHEGRKKMDHVVDPIRRRYRRAPDLHWAHFSAGWSTSNRQRPASTGL